MQAQRYAHLWSAFTITKLEHRAAQRDRNLGGEDFQNSARRVKWRTIGSMVIG